MLGYISQSGVTAQNRFSWSIIITNLYSANAVRGPQYQRGGRARKGIFCLHLSPTLYTFFVIFSKKFILSSPLLAPPVPNYIRWKVYTTLVNIKTGSNKRILIRRNLETFLGGRKFGIQWLFGGITAILGTILILTALAQSVKVKFWPSRWKECHSVGSRNVPGGPLWSIRTPPP